MRIETAKNSRRTVIELLKDEKLPYADLPGSLDNFLLAKDENGKITGVAGIELYGESALLRSLAVNNAFRSNGIAADLLLSIESLARANNVRCIYLLTETASGYFKKKGYQQIERESVPVEVQSTSEFSTVCPQSAMVMNKDLYK